MCAGLSRKAILSEIDETLKRLETDYVDLYQISRQILLPAFLIQPSVQFERRADERHVGKRLREIS